MEGMRFTKPQPSTYPTSMQVNPFLHGKLDNDFLTEMKSNIDLRPHVSPSPGFEIQMFENSLTSSCCAQRMSSEAQAESFLQNVPKR